MNSQNPSGNSYQYNSANIQYQLNAYDPNGYELANVQTEEAYNNGRTTRYTATIYLDPNKMGGATQHYFQLGPAGAANASIAYQIEVTPSEQCICYVFTGSSGGVNTGYSSSVNPPQYALNNSIAQSNITVYSFNCARSNDWMPFSSAEYQDAGGAWYYWASSTPYGANDATCNTHYYTSGNVTSGATGYLKTAY